MKTVVVDTREWEVTRDRIAAKLEDLGLKVVVKPLDISNYLIEREDKMIPLQRLHYKKYLQMVAVGEIYSLIYKLAGSDGVVLVEIEDLSDIGSNIPAYCRALEASLKATLKYRVPTLIVHSYLTPKIIYYLATEELFEDKERVKKIYTTDIQEIALSVLMKIPGVGPKTAARLLSTFKSLKGIANASLEDLLSVQGVGRQKAKLIYDVFHTEFRR